MAVLTRILGLLALAGCGDPLADASYRGVPLITLSGEVLQDEPLGELDGQLRVAVFWSSAGPNQGVPAEQGVQVTTEFPSRYEMSLYTPPADEAVRVDPFSGNPLAIGLPLLYVDADGDEAWEPGVEDVVGGSHDVALIWAPEELVGGGPPGQGPVPEPLAPGYHAVSGLLQTCDQGYLRPEPTSTDGVDLVVGSLWDYLVDTDCDGHLDEWDELCPECADTGG